MMNKKYTITHFFISLITLILLISPIVKAEEFAATLQWSKRVELSTPVSGVVQKVFAAPGVIVAKGEVLVQLDSRSYQADLKFAKANLANADAISQEAKRELYRQNDLYERTLLSEHDLQVAKNNFTSAQSRFFQAQSSFTKSKLNLEYSAVRAPFNALVINTSAVKGQIVVSELSPQILVVVAEAQRMRAKFYAAVDKANEFSLNQGVTVTIAGEDYQGKIFDIGLEPSQSKEGYYAVVVIFDSKEKVLRAGQKAKVNI